jgi:CRP/FNR family transcriptional regulator, cyclic AMP receptor protein
VEWPLLAGVPPETVREVLAIARRRTFARDEVVFHQGDPANALHLISKGCFAIKVLTTRGDVALLDVCGPGDAFGEMALTLPEGLRSATVAALEPAETFALYREEVTRLREGHPAVGDAMLLLMAERLRRANERITVAHYVDVDERVRWCLVRLARIYGISDGRSTIRLTQEQISEYAGATRPTVNRVLNEEADRGSLTLGRGKLEVLDVDALARRVRGIPQI